MNQLPTKEQILEKAEYKYRYDDPSYLRLSTFEAMEEYATVKAMPLVSALQEMSHQLEYRKKKGLNITPIEHLFAGICIGALSSYTGEEASENPQQARAGWTKEELRNMLEDVINELDLSEVIIEKNGPLGTPPATLVRLVLEQKDKQIRMLKAGFFDLSSYTGEQPAQQPADPEMYLALVTLVRILGTKHRTTEETRYWESANAICAKHHNPFRTYSDEAGEQPLKSEG